VVGRAAADAFAPQARGLGIDLIVAAAPPTAAELDGDRVGQIVANLVENALKYASTQVTVAVDVHDDELRIVVTDDGPGIPAADLTNVFTRLYIARGAPGRSVGTGLGLAIVQELAAAMGGHAAAETPAAGGARLVVTLPVARAATARV
jgi:signal transduction histidine kinase